MGQMARVSRIQNKFCVLRFADIRKENIEFATSSQVVKLTPQQKGSPQKAGVASFRNALILLKLVNLINQ